MSAMKKNQISNKKPQSVIITKVIIMEHESYKIMGSGYKICKSNGEWRLDCKDLKGIHLEPGWYNVQELSEYYIGFTTDSIN